MSERDKLILKLKHLIQTNALKQQQYQEENNNPEVGYLTREACVMASLLPQMQSLGITFEDCVDTTT